MYVHMQISMYSYFICLLYAIQIKAIIKLSSRSLLQEEPCGSEQFFRKYHGICSFTFLRMPFSFTRLHGIAPFLFDFILITLAFIPTVKEVSDSELSFTALEISLLKNRVHTYIKLELFWHAELCTT